MAGDASAYAALGLQPGADAIAVERAYKKLIKQHHPDREGGDPDRAAEIIWAYRELRTALAPQDTLILFDEPPVEKRHGGWARLALVMLVAVAGLTAFRGPLAAYFREIVPAQPNISLGSAATRPNVIDTMDQPLHVAAVDGAVRQAIAMLDRHDDTALLAASRDCHRQLRQEPSMTQLDRCAAFDDAVVQVQDRDPMWDEGPFSQMAVTGRQWSAATGLSNDYLAIDSRLDRIRLKVELSLAPPDPPRLPQITPSPTAQDQMSNASAWTPTMPSAAPNPKLTRLP